MPTRYWTEQERKDALHMEWEEFSQKYPEREFQSFRIKRDRLRRGYTSTEDMRKYNSGTPRPMPKSLEELKELENFGMVDFRR